jgi:hypothetical protein
MGVKGLESRKRVMAAEFLLVALNLYVRIKFSVATLCANYSGSDKAPSIAASIQHLPDSVAQSVSAARQTQSTCQVKRSGYRSV